MNVFTTHSVAHDGLLFPVLEAGAGEPLVLLHGGGSRALHFAGIMRELAPHFRVIAYDQRGFADNIVPDRTPISHAVWASDLIGMLDALGIVEAKVLGWSLGCSVAINAAAKWPERITALMLVGAPDPTRAVNVAALRRRQAEYGVLEAAELERRARADLAKQLAPGFVDDAPILDALVSDRMASVPLMQARVIDAYATRPDLLAAAHKVQAPVSLVTGEHDRICPPGAASAMARALGAAEPTIIAGAGHYIAAERPAALAHAMVSWMNDTVPRRKACP